MKEAAADPAGPAKPSRRPLNRCMAVRAPHLHAAVRAFCLAAFADLGRRPGGAEICRSSSTSTTRPLRVPAARPRPRRGAGLLAREAARRADRDRRAAAASRPRRSSPAAGDDATEDRALFQTILLPLLDADGRGLRRLRLGGRRVRARLRRARALAVRHRAHVRRGRAARRPLGRSPGRAGPRNLACAPPAVEELSSLAGGCGSAAARLRREPERTCVLELDRELPADEEHAARRAGRARRRRHGAPARDRRRRSRPGPVVFERLDWHPFGDPADAAGSPRPSPAASRPARPVARPARRRARRAARPLRGRRRARRGARALGAVAVRGRAAAFGAAARVARRAARRRRRALGGRDAGGDAPRRDGERERDARRRACARSRAASTGGARSPTRSAVRSSRPCSTTTARRLARRPRRGAARPPARPAGYFSTRASSTRVPAQRSLTRRGRRATVAAWRRHGASWLGSSGSRRSSASTCSRPRCSPSARACSRGRGVGPGRARRRPMRRCKSVAAVQRNARGHEQDSASLNRKTARHMAAVQDIARPHARASTSKGATVWQGHRVRQPEGRRREDDLDVEPRASRSRRRGKRCSRSISTRRAT